MPNNILIPYSGTPVTRFINTNFQGDTALPALVSANNPYTIEVWVKFVDVSTPQTIFYIGGNSGNTGLPQVAFTLNAEGKLQASRSADGQNAVTLESQTVFEANEWYFIALTYEMGVLNLYINAFIEDSKVSVLASNLTGNFFIGSGFDTNGTRSYANCFIQSVGMWAVSRQSDEVIQDMGATPSPQTNLAVWYDFAQAPCIDVSGNNHHFVMSNFINSIEIPVLSLGLDGTGYGDCGQTDSLDFSGNVPYTLEAMVSLNSNENIGTFISRFIVGGGTGQYDLGVGSAQQHSISGGSTIPYFNTYHQSSPWWLFSRTTPVLGTWYHVASTYDGTTLSIYVNGVLEASLPWAGPNPTIAVNTLIGSYYNQNNTVAASLASDFAYVRAWNVCRTAAEVQEFMNKNPLNETGLAANYDFSSMSPVEGEDGNILPYKYRDLTTDNLITLKGSSSMNTVSLNYPTANIPSAPNIDTVVTYEYMPIEQGNLALLAKNVSQLETTPQLKVENFSEPHYNLFIQEFEKALGKDAVNGASRLADYKSKVKNLFEQTKNDPEKFAATRPFRRIREGNKHILLYLENGIETPVLELASKETSDNSIEIILLTVELVLTIIFGILNVFGLGLAANAAKKLSDWLTEEPELCASIVKVLIGATITAGSIWVICKLLLTGGFLKKIILMVCSLSFWAVLRVLVNITITVLAPEAKAAQVIASLAITAVHAGIIAYNLEEAIRTNK